MDLSEQLKQMAIKKGLCEDHILKWNYDSVNELLQYYVANPEWCLGYKYPGKEFLLKHFTPEEREANGIYIDCDMSKVKNFNYSINVLIDCVGEIEISDYKVFRFYVADKCNISFIASGNSKLFIDCYDNSHVYIEQKDAATATAYMYGGKANTKGNVNIKTKKLKIKK